MELRVGERIFPLAEVGPDFLVLRAPVELPPCLATLWISIDGREREKKVCIPKGIDADSREVEIALP